MVRIEDINSLKGTYKGVAFEQAEIREIQDCLNDFVNRLKICFGNLASVISKVDFEKWIIYFEEGKVVQVDKPRK
ncbi:MAG: hypothetical protein A4E27_00654 [Methanobacterium sp. PtaU1.Bin242]|nr:MAG: hypothetical protein A4E27_00654 [Methanobacterium sp. PtaU1.Bin242]